MGPPLAHRLSLEESAQLLKAEGFEVIENHSFTDAFYGLVAVKK
jgi:hypothetical protein